jgi:hypothetical protein
MKETEPVSGYASECAHRRNDSRSTTQLGMANLS